VYMHTGSEKIWSTFSYFCQPVTTAGRSRMGIGKFLKSEWLIHGKVLRNLVEKKKLKNSVMNSLS